jgi:hypothetical protein
MSDELQRQIEQTESALASDLTNKKGGEIEKGTFRKSAVISILCIVILISGQYLWRQAADALRTPTESQLEYELAEVLQVTAGVLESYRSQHGKLPEVIPNPAYGAVVGYERLDNYSYILTTKYKNVTLEMPSSTMRPRRVSPANSM